VGQKTVLVPYRPEHLPTYHEWMQDPYLLEMTGSEPLSMEEEIAMQQSWRDDDAKCTFIVLEKGACVGLSGDDCSGYCSDGSDGTCTIRLSQDFVEQNLKAMIGDVNLFLSEEDHVETDDEDDGDNDTNAETAAAADPVNQEASDESTALVKQAELDIMIAEPSARGKGMGSEASRIMMLYGAQNMGIRRYFAKIKKENDSSKTLFGKLKFVECNYVECFGEHEYELRRDSATDMANTMLRELGFDVVQCDCKLKPN